MMLVSGSNQRFVRMQIMDLDRVQSRDFKWGKKPASDDSPIKAEYQSIARLLYFVQMKQLVLFILRHKVRENPHVATCFREFILVRFYAL